MAAVAALSSGVIATVVLARTSGLQPRPDDFIEYWAAGRLNIAEGNPYSAAELAALQHEHLPATSAPLIMWNPPPALTLAMPFGLLGYREARLAWLVASLWLALGCGLWLGRVYGGASARWVVSVIVTAVFFPTQLALFMGQITVWMLAGVVGFIAFAAHRRWVAAGACLVLVGLKPHVSYLLLAVLGLWTVKHRVWGVAIGAGAALLVSWLIPTLVNPDVTHQYAEALRTSPPTYWVTATVGGFLREMTGWNDWWIQMLPSVVGLVWAAWYFQRRAAVWSWTQEAPLLLLVSTTTMTFGWPFDLVVILPAIIQMTVWVLSDSAGWGRAWFFALYGLVNGVALWQSRTGATLDQFVWMAPVFLAMYLVVRIYRSHHGGLERGMT